MTSNDNNLSGFTLIELLVTVAVLGILVAIVLGNIGGGRDRARDTALLETMQQMLTFQVINYDVGEGFSEDPCAPTGVEMQAFMNALSETALSTPVCSSQAHATGSGIASWRVSVEGITIDTAAGERYCVDSDGFIGVIEYGDPDGDYCPQGS